VSIDAFEGPLDLLLHLIKTSEVDIYDIPIAPITNQYVRYLDLMGVLNIEVAGEYLVMAAELGLIKSRMLLPREETDGDDETLEDPREELVRRLLEYQRYKDVSEELSRCDLLGRDVFSPPPDDDAVLSSIPQEIEKRDVWALLGAVQDILRRREQSQVPPLSINLEPMSLEEKIVEIDLALRSSGRIDFEELFTQTPTRFVVVITFLAVLELIRSAVVMVYQEMPFSRIELLYVGGAAAE